MAAKVVGLPVPAKAWILRDEPTPQIAGGLANSALLLREIHSAARPITPKHPSGLSRLSLLDLCCRRCGHAS